MNTAQLIIGDVEVEKPIIQGGMGVGISLSNLAGHVASYGGIGLISAAQIGFREDIFSKNPKAANIAAIVSELKKAREISEGRGLVGFNIMVATKGYEDYVKTAVMHGADIIVSGAGLALDLPALVDEGMALRHGLDAADFFGKDKKLITKYAPIVSSEKSVNVILKLWDRKYKKTADIIIIEGPLAGGHLGFSSFELSDLGSDTEYVSKTYKRQLYDQEIINIIRAVEVFEKKYGKKIPVVSAGGIYTHEDFMHALSLGVCGVQIGTRFVTTHECDAPLSYKQAYIDAGESDIIITKSPVGMPGRAIKNNFLKKLMNGRIPVRHCHDCLTKCDRVNIPYCITEALIAAANGDIDNALLFAGANAWRCSEIETVKEVMDDIISGNSAEKQII
jgi:2-nitropropane dioxygenase NPD